MRVLNDLIHARAIQTFHEPIDIDNYKEWASHWISSAREIAKEFDAINLPETAKAVRIIADQQESFYK